MNRHHKETLRIATEMLKLHGHTVKTSVKGNLSYTLFVDGVFKVAVRMSNLHIESTHFYQFKITNYDEVDFALLIGTGGNDSRTYIVPRKALKEHMKLSLGYRARLSEYVDAWGLLNGKDSCPFDNPSADDCAMCPKQTKGWCEACRQWCYIHRFQYSNVQE